MSKIKVKLNKEKSKIVSVLRKEKVWPKDVEDIPEDEFKRLSTVFKNFGYRAISRKSTSRAVFINKEKGFVAKFPYLTLDRFKSKHQIPHVISTKKFSAIFMVQPLTKRTNLRSCCKKLDKLVHSYVDLHEGNVGWYEGEPCLIDW